MSSAPVSRRNSLLAIALVVGALIVMVRGIATVTSGGGLAPTALASTADRSTATGSIYDLPGGAGRRFRRQEQRRPAESIPLGTPTAPFAPLPPDDRPRLILSPTGLALPVIEPRGDGWLVSTACQAVRVVTEGRPIARAHVVLDPGHGGAEPGAVGPTGLVEKDLNLEVAREAASILRRAGATVVLTRDGDHTMTAAARGLVARAVGPALLVSVHHNGGAEAGPAGPGTIVFTKAGSDEATRFGALFHQTITPMLEGAADEARERHRVWSETMAEYERRLVEHSASVGARDAAVATGEATPVPTTLPEPAEPEGDPVPEFRWAGSGNAGVRSWVRVDGRDHLAVLRSAGPSPAALVEFPYVTNPSEEALLASEGFLAAEGQVLAEAVVRYLGGEEGGTGYVADQSGDEPIGGGGSRAACVEPALE